MTSQAGYGPGPGQRAPKHRRSQGGPKEPCPPKFLENIVILCFEKRFSKQNSVIHLKSSILAPPKFFPKNFWAGYATAPKQSFSLTTRPPAGVLLLRFSLLPRILVIQLLCFSYLISCTFRGFFSILLETKTQKHMELKQNLVEWFPVIYCFFALFFS